MAEAESEQGEPKLKIIAPEVESDKSFMVSFKPNNELEAQAYGYAVDKIFRERNLNPFLQSYDSEDPLSEQRWETLFQGNSEETRQKIEEALPEIEQVVKEYIDDTKALG